MLLLAPGLAPGAGEEQKPVILVSTSLLQAAVEDIYGDRVKVKSIIPPGGCPGHYDMTPSDLRDVAGADLIVLHAYQDYMKKKLSEAGLNKKPVLMAAEEGSPISPPGYRFLLRVIAEQVPEALPALGPAAEPGLMAALSRVKEAEAAARGLERGVLKGKPVCANAFQADFCSYWGMEVAAVIGVSGDMSAKEFERMLKSSRERGVAAVAGNRQSGEKEAAAVAERLGVPLAMLSNFPAERGPEAYRRLLLSNVKALVDVFGRE